MSSTPQERTPKRVHDDELRPGDDIFVPVLQDGEGKNVLEASHKRNDPYAHGCPTFRIPVPAQRKRIHFVAGEVWRGTVESVVPTGRTVYRPGKKEVVEVRLKDMRPVKASEKYSYFRYRNYVVEVEELLIGETHIATLHRDFSPDGITEDALISLPELTFEEHFAMRKRLDWKLRRIRMSTSAKKRLLAQIARTTKEAQVVASA